MNKQEYIENMNMLLSQVEATVEAVSDDFKSVASPNEDGYDKALVAFVLVCKYVEHLCDKIYKEGQEDA